MNGARKIILSLVILLSVITLSGSIIKIPEMTLGVDKNIVYQNESAETFLIRSVSNADNAKKVYHNAYYVFYGTIRAKLSDKKFYIGSVSTNTKDTLYCVTSDSEVKKAVADLYVGNTVKVYGKMACGLDGKWTMTVHKMEKSDEDSVSSTAYSVLDGTTLDKVKMISRELNGGKVKFWISEKWEGVEKNLVKDGLGSMEGYQYCLNEIDQQSVQPESFFVCYFSNDKHLLRSGDKKETEGIERAIVKNILKADPGSANLQKSTYYGTTYHYYQSAYKSLLGQNYHAEFVFQPDGTDGFIVYLYIYREKKHQGECMITMRLLEAN